MVYVPSKLIVHGNAAATASNISASEPLFRLGIAAQLISQAGFIFVALALYHLLKAVNCRHASLMVTLVVVSIPIAFLNEVNSSPPSFSCAERTSYPYSISLNGTLWLCCSSICIFTALLLTKYFSVCGFYRSHCWCTGRDSCPIPRHLASHRRLGLGDPEPYRGTVAAILRQGVYLRSARLLRGGRVHAMAHHQGCQASTAARRNLISAAE